MPHPATALRAEQLATLDGLVTLPAAVSNAVHAYQAAQQMPVPAWPQPGAAAQATAVTAAQIARAALDDPGVLTQPLDVNPITTARDAEQAARDRTTLAAEVQAAAQELLCATVTAHEAAVVQVIQARHADMTAVLVKCAHRLPPGTDDQAALQAGGSIRTDYLAARDATATAASLREALRLAEDAASSEEPDGLTITTAYERTGALYQSWLAPTWTTTYGDPGTLEFWLNAGREPGFEWWLPDSSQLHQRLAELRTQQQHDRAARLPAEAVF